ncbi:MAG: histidinol-phosphate transaminase [Gammaproteobacteria bacterium]
MTRPEQGTQGLDEWLRPEIRQLQAYEVHAAEGCLKLDAMEGPYAWPEPVQAEWLAALRTLSVNRYPDPEARTLKHRLRAFLGLPDSLGLLLGNGSDELIQMLALAVAGVGRVLLSPEPSFAMYRIIAAIAGLRYVGVPLLAPAFDLDVAAMLDQVRRHRPALVTLSYPNNPTGNLFERGALEAILEQAPGLVLADEAYFNYCGDSLLAAIEEHPRLLVLRTLSKIGLAGLRIGVLIGREDWLREINKLRLPYNINTLSQASAAFILAHPEVLDAQVRTLVTERERLYTALRRIPRVQVWPSRANFLLLRVIGRGKSVFAGLKARRVLVKDLDGAHPLLRDCLRVTIGTPNENDEFIAAFRDCLA